MRRPRRRTPSRRPIWRALLPFARPFASGMALVALLIVVGTFLRVLQPWPLKFLFDDVLLDQDDDSVEYLLALIAAAIVGIALVNAVVGFLRTYLLKRAGQHVAFALRVALYRKINKLPLAYHDNARTGDLITTVTKDVDKVQELITDYAVDGSSDTLTLVGMFAVAFYLDWQLALAMILLNPLLFLLSWRYRRRVGATEQMVRGTEGEVASIAQETISSIKLVKAYGREDFEALRFTKHAGAFRDANLKAMRAEAAYGSGVDVITAVAMAGLVWFGAHRVLSGALTAGELLVFTSYVRDFYGPARSLSKLGAKVARARIRAEKLVEVLDLEPTVRDRPGAVLAPAFEGRLRFQHVSFSYLPGEPVLSDIDFEVEPGSVVAIVGATGAGKSTLAALLGRLYDPILGRVLIDGVDIRDYTLTTLQQQISYVLQEAVLFRASVSENIAYGRPGAPQALIEATARLAGAHDFISELPDGYATVVGERGDTLSGGQRQRVAIARALLRNAPLLVLDEPTTGLDARTEQELLDSLDALTSNRTTLVIAHRLSTIRRADRILVLDRGRIVESGTHQELLASGGQYAQYWRIQTGDLESEDSQVDTAEGEAPEEGQTAPPQTPSAGHPDARPHGRRHRTETDDAAGSSASTAQKGQVMTRDDIPGANGAQPNANRPANPPPDEESLARDELSPDTMRQLLGAYDLGQWVECRRTEKGSSNTSFFITTTAGRFVLRRSNDRKTLESMEFEAQLIEHLRDYFYFAPEIVPTRGGKPYAVIDSTFYFLTVRIPGSPYDGSNNRHLIEAAHGLARYHQIAARFKGQAPASTVLVIPGLSVRGPRALGQFGVLAQELLSASAHAELQRAFDLSARHAERLSREVSAVGDLPETIIQGSYGRSALLFCGDVLGGVVDYDRAGRDLRAIDLAYATKALCRSALGTGWIGLDTSRLVGFLAAYQEVERLPREEVEALPLVFQLQRLSKLIRKCENLARKHAIVPQAEKDVDKVAAVVSREIARMQWLDENSERLVAELVS